MPDDSYTTDQRLNKIKKNEFGGVQCIFDSNEAFCVRGNDE